MCSADLEREIVEAKRSIAEKEAQLRHLRSQLHGLHEQVQAAQAQVHQLQASASALEDKSSMQHELDQAKADLAQCRDAYKGESGRAQCLALGMRRRSDNELCLCVEPALERRFSSSVTDMEGRFRVVLADKDAQVQVAQEGYARLQECLTGFQAQLESAKAEAETLVSESSMAAEHWRNKVRAGCGGAATLERRQFWW